jgi:hypothetical protein
VTNSGLVEPMVVRGWRVAVEQRHGNGVILASGFHGQATLGLVLFLQRKGLLQLAAFPEVQSRFQLFSGQLFKSLEEHLIGVGWERAFFQCDGKLAGGTVNSEPGVHGRLLLRWQLLFEITGQLPVVSLHGQSSLRLPSRP